MSARTPKTTLEKAAMVAVILAYLPISAFILMVSVLALAIILYVWPWALWFLIGGALIFILICAAIRANEINNKNKENDK